MTISNAAAWQPTRRGDIPGLTDNTTQFATPLTGEPDAAAASTLGRGAVAPANQFETATLAQLVDSTGRDFWVKAAESERTPPALLRALAESDDSDLVLAVASNISINGETRDLLAKHDDGAVRASLIYGPNADEAFLEQFYDDDDYDVVAALCQNSTSADQLEKLVEVEFAPKYEIAANPAISSELLTKLASDENKMVRGHALRNRNVTAELIHAAASDPELSIREAAARHAKVNVKTQRLLAQSPDVRVRESLAMNRNTDAAILATLTGDEHPEVRNAATRVLNERRGFGSF